MPGSYDKIPAIKGEKRINARVDLSLNAEPQHRMDPRSFHKTEFPRKGGKEKIQHVTGFTGYSVRHSVISHPFVTPWTAARQAPLSMGFSRQGHWSGLPFPPPEALPCPGMEPRSPALQAGSLGLDHQGSLQAPSSLNKPPPRDGALTFCTTTFQTWPRGWFHIPKDPDFPVPS